MNKHKLPILSLSLLLLITACKKMDVQNQNSGATTAASVAAPGTNTGATEWKSVTNWTSTKQDKFTMYYSAITDSSITASVTNSGLVLVYKKNGSSVNALPYEEKSGNDLFWYYSISTNTLAISVDAYGADQNVNSANGFKYFVFSDEQLKALEAKGISKSALMKMSYAEAAALKS